MRKSKIAPRNPRGPINWELSEEEKETIRAHNKWVKARRDGKNTKRYKAR